MLKKQNEQEPAGQKDDQGYLHSLLDGRLKLYVGDITKQDVDAIVNAANTTLLGGGGVDGAIHRCGGEALTAACRKLRSTDFPDGLPVGQVALTIGGALPATWVIHTVGPIYGRHHGQEAELLAACYRNALLLARKNGCKTIAFPAISTGVYGYPRQEAAAVVGETLRTFLASDTHFDEIRLVFFRAEDSQVFLVDQWGSMGSESIGPRPKP